MPGHGSVRISLVRNERAVNGCGGRHVVFDPLAGDRPGGARHGPASRSGRSAPRPRRSPGRPAPARIASGTAGRPSSARASRHEQVQVGDAGAMKAICGRPDSRRQVRGVAIRVHAQPSSWSAVVPQASRLAGDVGHAAAEHQQLGEREHLGHVRALVRQHPGESRGAASRRGRSRRRSPRAPRRPCAMARDARRAVREWPRRSRRDRVVQGGADSSASG